MPSALWTKAQALVFGAAVGRAGSEAVTPVLEPVRQRAWSRNKLRVLDLGRLGELAAKGFATPAQLADEAGRSGYDANRLEAVMALAQSYPGLAELDRMSNRDAISDALVDKALSRHGIPAEYQPAVKALFRDLLSPSDVANAVQQGHMPNDGILPDVSAGVEVAGGAVTATAPDGQPPSSVPLTQIDLDPIKEASGAGIDLDRLKVIANLAGLPPGPEALLAMWNRNLIDEESVNAGIREGHMKTKWAGAFKRMRWAVLSGQEYAEARLRDWITDAEMYEGGALTGHTKDQMDLFYRNRGRPATPRQIWLGWARKIVAPDYPDDPANGRLTGLKDHELAIRRSNIRPEYAKLLWDVRFNYVPVFQLNRLVAAKVIDADTAADWAHKNLVAPEVVEKLREFWLKPATTAQKEASAADLLALYDGEKATLAETLAALEALGYPADEAQAKVDVLAARRVTSARNAAISDLHAAFKKGELLVDAVTVALGKLVLDPEAVPLIVAAWQAYKDAFPPPAPAPVV